MIYGLAKIGVLVSDIITVDASLIFDRTCSDRTLDMT